MFNYKKIIAALLLFFATFSVLASNLCKVNLIIFSKITKQALQSENWPSSALQPALKDAIVLSSNPESNGIYQLLPNSRNGLNREARILGNNPNYRVILHASWIQPATKAKWVNIKGGLSYDENGNFINASVNPNPVFWEINGLIKINKERNFDIWTELYLTLPESIIKEQMGNEMPGNVQSTPLRTFTLTQDARLHINEVHYFDHPLFGMLVQITNY